MKVISMVVLVLLLTAAVEALAAEEIKKDGKFIVYNDGTIVDASTGLMWAASDNGSNVNWEQAKEYCENFEGGGYTDWRLPSRDELSTTVNAKSDKKFKIFDSFTLSACCPWTADTRGKKQARSIFFMAGESMWYKKSYSKGFRALPVRDAR